MERSRREPVSRNRSGETKGSGLATEGRARVLMTGHETAARAVVEAPTPVPAVLRRFAIRAM